ncbi:hypothetical protein ACFL0W_04980 [Nanoarchaeota archaeon]
MESEEKTLLEWDQNLSLIYSNKLKVLWKRILMIICLFILFILVFWIGIPSIKGLSLNEIYVRHKVSLMATVIGGFFGSIIGLLLPSITAKITKGAKISTKLTSNGIYQTPKLNTTMQKLFVPNAEIQTKWDGISSYKLYPEIPGINVIKKLSFKPNYGLNPLVTTESNFHQVERIFEDYLPNKKK